MSEILNENTDITTEKVEIVQTAEKSKKAEAGEKTEKVKRPKVKRKDKKILYGLQHVLLALIAISVVVILTGQSVTVHSYDGTTTYNLQTSDQEKSYVDSEMFNNIFGQSVVDVIRYGVLSAQLETNGVYDGRKVIDVTAYNNRQNELPSSYITADYYLEDLIKWARNGYEYTRINTNSSLGAEFLAPQNKVTTVNYKSKNYDAATATYLKSDLSKYTDVSGVSANDIDDEILNFNVLVNRYKTVENKNIEDYVADWNSYSGLCNEVCTAADNLAYNYDEYLSYNDFYQEDKTNLHFCVERKVGNATYISTNMNSAGLDVMTEKEREIYLQKLMNENSKYLYYSPSDMEYITNTDIDENSIRSVLRKYEYAYPETTKFWVVTDTTFPISDQFTEGQAGFGNYLPYYWELVAATVFAVLLYLALLMYLTASTGNVVEDGVKSVELSGFDRLPTEVGLFIFAGASLVLFFAGLMLWDNIVSDSVNYETYYSVWFKVIVCLIAFFADAYVMYFYYSFIRRIKARLLWKNSLLYKLCLMIKSGLWNVYDNGSLVIRTWVPFAVFALFNIFMALLLRFSDVRAIIVIFVMIVIDIPVGIFVFKDAKERRIITDCIEKINRGETDSKVDAGQMHGDNLVLANSVNSIGTGIKKAVEVSMKDERMKADLITNVSHDIKTPLTSIINYVDLLKRENIDNDKAKGYIKVLDEKSQRLKQLTDDLVEASKISSGNMVFQYEKLNLVELINQSIGEFSEKFEEKCLSVQANSTVQSAYINADPRRLFRVIENLFGNVYKYALEGTRVYITVEVLKNEKGIDFAVLSIKNISAKELNCSPDELVERFIRGDESRTTEGSGLGLSIAKNLTEAMGGSFNILVDGDLFKVIVAFGIVQ